MHTFSIIMIVLSIGFLMLAGLLAHERLAARDGSVPAPAATLRHALDRAVANALSNYERDTVVGAVVPVILFMVLPGAALLNALFGGSPFMITCYLLIFISVVVHLLFAESPKTGALRALLAGVGALLALVFLPYYAAWSLTNHILLTPPAQSAVAGTLIAVILYAANAGFWSLVHTPAAGMQASCAERFMASILFSTPLGYAGYWFGLLAVSIGGGDVGSGQEWSVLIFVSFFVGIAFASFKALLDGARSLRSVWVGAGIGVVGIAVALAVH